MIKEYVKGKPYFCDVTEKIQSFPYLDYDISCDCLIVGGGIDGAITAYYFAENNLDTILIDKNRLGFLNTSCATALLEYQLDDHANDLKRFFTKEDVVNIYRVGLNALKDIDLIIRKLGNKCQYNKRDTLIFSTKKGDKKEIIREFEFRKNNKFPVYYVDEIHNPFPFSLKTGLLAKNGGAEFNPYLFEKQLIDYIKNKIKIFENTEAKQVIKKDDMFEIITNYGVKINCKYLICCTGYNSSLFTNKKLCEKYISYTIVTEPLKKKLWNGELLQDNSDPYHYLRLSPNNRLIIGGEDILFKGDFIKDKDAVKKYQMLKQYAIEMFSQLEYVNIDYKFCGVFSTTKNNLSVIGEDERIKNLFYNLGYGANGIVYSIYGAKNLVNLILGKSPSPYLSFFFSTSKITIKQ